MKTEPEVGIKIPLSKVQKLKQHVLAEELYVGYLKKVKMWKLVSQWYFQLRANYYCHIVSTQLQLTNIYHIIIRETTELTVSTGSLEFYGNSDVETV